MLRQAPAYNRCLALAADVVVSRGGQVARVRPVTQNTPAGIRDGGAHHQPTADPRPKESPAMTIMSEAEHRARVIDGVRMLATFLETHPDVPVGFTPVSLEFAATASRGEEEARAEVDRVAALLGVVTETSPHGTYSASKCFGAATYRVYATPRAERGRVTAALSYLDNITPEAAS